MKDHNVNYTKADPMEQTNVDRSNGWMDEWMNGQTDGRRKGMDNGWTDGQRTRKEGKKEGRTKGRKKKEKEEGMIITSINIPSVKLLYFTMK